MNNRRMRVQIKHRQRGDGPPVGIIMLVGLVVIPLVLVLAMFSPELVEWLKDVGVQAQIPDNALVLAMLAGALAVIGFWGKRLIEHFERRARLLILEHLSREGSITRQEARKLLWDDTLWFKFYRNVHIDTLAELVDRRAVSIKDGAYVLESLSEES